MNLPTIAYVVASFLAFLAERMFSGDAAVRWPVLGLAVLAALVSLGARARTLSSNPTGTKLALGFAVLSMSAAVFAVLHQREMLAAFELSAESEKRARVVLQAGMALAWFLGALPYFALNRTLATSPRSAHPARVHAAVEGGLGVALGLAMLFPINYLASERNERWDFGFFKVTEVGTATRQVVDNLQDPIRAVLFFPSNSEVLREIRPYFDDLEGGQLTVEVMDAVLEPEQAKAWKVRDNGNIAFVRGTGDDEQVESVKLTDKLDTARKDLRKLDSKVQTALLKLARDKRTAYFVVGHGEAFWKGADDDQSNIELMKKLVEGLNFKVKELGADDGLAVAVPEDAAVVFVAGPQESLFPEEVASLRTYRDKGGPLFLMLEPSESDQLELAALAGVSFYGVNLVSDKAYIQVTRGPADKVNVITNKFSSHESMSTLTKHTSDLFLVTPTAGAIDELDEHAGKVTVTVRAMPDWWDDRDGDLEYDKDTEKKGGHELAAVATGPAEDGKEWRVAVIGDVTWATNFVLPRSPASQVYLVETLGWLTQDPALGGETQSEEDVKIQHTKEGEATWFYGTIAGVPALVFGLGALRVRGRRIKGAA